MAAPSGAVSPQFFPLQGLEETARIEAEVQSAQFDVQGGSYCAVELQERVHSAPLVTSYRANYTFSGVSNWSLLSVTEPASDSAPSVDEALRKPGSSTISSSDSSDRNLGSRIAPAALAGDDAAALRRSVVNLLLAPQGSDRSALLREAAAHLVPLLGKGSASFGFNLWTGKLSGARSRRVLVFPKLENDCTLRWDRIGADLPLPVDATIGEGLLDDGRLYWVEQGNPIEDAIAKRTLRISFQMDNGLMDACTGYLLTPTLALTASHCVDGSRSRFHPNCVLDPKTCASFAADVDYRNGPDRPLVSIPVLGAETKPGLDFALLRLGAHPALSASMQAGPGLTEPVNGVALLSHAEQKTKRAMIIGHPMGLPSLRSNCQFNEDCPAGDTMLHQCFTLGGSSGAIIWRDYADNPAALGLHTGFVQKCDGTQIAFESVSESLRRYVKNKKLYNQKCVGKALRMGSIYQAQCLPQPTRSDCSDMLAALLHPDGPLGVHPGAPPPTYQAQPAPDARPTERNQTEESAKVTPDQPQASGPTP